MPIDEKLADLLAHQPFSQAQSTLPAVTLLRGASELGAVELKVLVTHFFREHSGASAQDRPRRPQLPIRKLGVCQQLSEVLLVSRHHIDHAVPWQPAALQDGAHNLWQVLEVRRVIRLYRVPGSNYVPVSSGNLLF